MPHRVSDAAAAAAAASTGSGGGRTVISDGIVLQSGLHLLHGNF